MVRPDQPFLWPSLSTSSALDPPRPGSISTTTHRHPPPWKADPDRRRPAPPRLWRDPSARRHAVRDPRLLS